MVRLEMATFRFTMDITSTYMSRYHIKDGNIQVIVLEMVKYKLNTKFQSYQSISDEQQDLKWYKNTYNIYQRDVSTPHLQYSVRKKVI